MSKNISYLSSRVGVKNNLFEAQQKLTSAENPEQAKKVLADKSLIGVAIVESSSSFYDFIDGDNAGKKAYVCNGSACLCAGGQDQVRHRGA